MQTFIYNDNTKLIVGKNSVLEALKSKNIVAKSLFILESKIDKKINKCMILAEKKNVYIKIINQTRFYKILSYNEQFVPISNQGIILIILNFNYINFNQLINDKINTYNKDKEDNRLKNKLFLMLDSVTDPQNLGGIIRSSTAFQCNGIIIPKRRSCSINTTVWKTSAGTVSNMLVARVTNLNQSIDYMKKKNIFIIGLDQNSTLKLDNLNLCNFDLCLIAGSEFKGISKTLKNKCDYLVSIPISKKVNSLNVSIAIAIALYELQKKYSLK